MNVDPLKQNPYATPRGDVADWSGRRLARFADCWSAGLFALLAGIPLLAISWGLYFWTNRLPLDEWMSSGEPILLSGVVLGGLSAVLAQMMAFRKATWLLTVVGRVAGVVAQRSPQWVEASWGLPLVDPSHSACVSWIPCVACAIADLLKRGDTGRYPSSDAPLPTR